MREEEGVGSTPDGDPGLIGESKDCLSRLSMSDNELEELHPLERTSPEWVLLVFL